MFKGYMRYGTTEVANVARVAAYAENGIVPEGLSVEDCGDCDEGLRAALGHDPYDSPLVDSAPWMSPGTPGSDDFAGVVVLEATGLMDSPMTAEVTDRITEGGVAGSRRARPKVVAVTALAVARTGQGLNAGLSWLGAALHPPCAGGDCRGDTLHLFSACPEMCEGMTDPDGPWVTSPVAVETLSVVNGSAFPYPANPRTNTITNPSFEGALGAALAGGWSAYTTGTPGTVDRLLVASPGVTSGETAQRVHTPALPRVGASAGVSTVAALAPGPFYTEVNLTAVQFPPFALADLVVECRNASNTVLTTLTVTATGSGVIRLPYTAPALTTNARVILQHRNDNPDNNAPPVGVEVVWDSAMLVQGGRIDYFDGDSPDTPGYEYAWSGAPYASSTLATGAGGEPWLFFDHDGSTNENGTTRKGQIITPVQPGVCDGVTATWTIKGAYRTVRLQFLDSSGNVVQEGPEVFLGGLLSATTRTLSLTAETSPGFPEGWRAALVTDGDIDAAVTLTARVPIDPEDCIPQYRRTLHDVVVIEGPKVVEEYAMGGGETNVAKVEWTFVAGRPHTYHDPVLLLGAVDAGSSAAPAYVAPIVQVSGASTVNGAATDCNRPAPSLLSCADNACAPPIVAPPTAPALVDPSIMDLTSTTYTRRSFQLPPEVGPTGLGVLSWEFANDAKPKLGVRVRVWEDPDPDFGNVEECGFVQEFTIDYLGAGQTLTIDAATGTATALCGVDAYNRPVTANALRNLSGSYGGPFTFAPIGCGRRYHVAVDLPDTYTATCQGAYTSGATQGELTWSVSLTRRD